MSKIKKAGTTDTWGSGTLAMLTQQPNIKKTSTILVYGHVDIHVLWTYRKAKIKCWLLDDFLRDYFALIIDQ